MKADLYADALIAMVKAGKTPEAAVKTLADRLKQDGKMSALKRLPAALARRESELARRTQTILEVAERSDADKAKAEAGVPDALVREDGSLIGGWRLISGSKLVDNSFKKHLLDVYSKITR